MARAEERAKGYPGEERNCPDSQRAVIFPEQTGSPASALTTANERGRD
ncbi:hypothetical protein HMPREF9946_05048 [Acetobacteraceae bacterium AT-5844]|nr:hypothetical protein HMPREF9946_05048 [Acetobacteraceae bacterium AT-5844]